MVEFEIEGIEELKRTVNQFIEGLGVEAEYAMEMEASKLLVEAKDLCPVDTGRLRKSGIITKLDEQDLITWTVRFGDLFGVDYAVIVHEIPFEHILGQWKYLETPFKQNYTAGLIVGRVCQTIEKVFS